MKRAELPRRASALRWPGLCTRPLPLALHGPTSQQSKQLWKDRSDVGNAEMQSLSSVT